MAFFSRLSVDFSVGFRKVSTEDAFFEGCQRLKGYARSLDLAKLMHQTQAMSKKQINFMNQTSEILGLIRALLGSKYCMSFDVI